MTAKVFNDTVVQKYIEGIQQNLVEKGYEKLSDQTLQTLRQEAGQDNKKFVVKAQTEATKNIFEKEIKALNYLPDEVY